MAKYGIYSYNDHDTERLMVDYLDELKIQQK